VNLNNLKTVISISVIKNALNTVTVEKDKLQKDGKVMENDEK